MTAIRVPAKRMRRLCRYSPMREARLVVTGSGVPCGIGTRARRSPSKSQADSRARTAAGPGGGD